MSCVFRWDLDKTYLKTDFDSVKDLVKTALQPAEDKQNIAGTGSLMRELCYDIDGSRNRIYVVSGSPRQMRRVLARKLKMDAVDVDGFTLKPNLENLFRLRFRALRDQLGYKLPTLLESRLAMTRAGEQALRETCFGDDAEMDAIVYRLFSDICAHRIGGPALDRVLSAAKLYPDQAERIRHVARTIPAHDPVDRILIHLETGSPTERFLPLGSRVAPTFNTFQAALVLGRDGRLALEAVVRIAIDMKQDDGYTQSRLQRSLEDAVRRGLVTPPDVADVVGELGLDLPPAAALPAPSEAEAAVDYVPLLAEVERWHHARKSQRKKKKRRLSGLLGDD